ncbi:hypothetical protein F2P56_019840 [Juglans regia]|uniref:Uncharacterized protein LOC108984465 n=2 Tax=Juglans regia TaxID=51240 RepID=A0A2I4DXV1_JUGRE|nr:uncharacterized protein LOC108984465 [Juglans regia]KAF5459934.1 hypothetical protein F2P56_019840 [Juglans regia]
MHVVWQCQATRDVWAVSFRAAKKWSSAEDNFLLLWDIFTDRLSYVELELAAVLMRMLWLRRNSFIFEDKFKDPESLVRTVKATLDDFQDAQENEKGQEFSVSNEARGGDRANHRWIKPIQCFIKANWDASLRKHSLGLGIVLRDDK